MNSINIPSGGLNVVIQVVGTLIEVGLVLTIIASFIFLLIGGVKWITSQGDKQGLASAKGTVTYAIIGLLLAFISFSVLHLISTMIGTNLGVGFGTRAFTTPNLPGATFSNPNLVPQ